MSDGEFLPTGGAYRHKKPLSAAKRKKILAAYKSVPAIQRRNDELAAEEAGSADDLLDSYFSPDNAQDKDHNNPRASNGQRQSTDQAA